MNHRAISRVGAAAAMLGLINIGNDYGGPIYREPKRVKNPLVSRRKKVKAARKANHRRQK